MIKSRNTQFTHYHTYQEAKLRRKKLKIFNFLLLFPLASKVADFLYFTRVSSDATSQEVVFLASGEARVNRVIANCMRFKISHVGQPLLMLEVERRECHTKSKLHGGRVVCAWPKFCRNWF